MAPSFSVSDLKQKAAQAKTASLKGYASARDRVSNSSKPTTSSKSPPPHPPVRSTSSVSSISKPAPAAPPRPVAREKPNASSYQPAVYENDRDVDHIDWVNLTEEDRLVFFTWLDEFFARYLNLPPPPPRINLKPPASSPPFPSRGGPPPTPRRSTLNISNPSIASQESAQASMTPPPQRNLPPMLAAGGPPKINFSTKPDSFTSTAPSDDDFQLSHPPATIHGSSALDLAYYISKAVWNTAWYTSGTVPPPLENSSDIRWAGGMGMSYNEHTQTGGILFSDLSACWYTISYPPSSTSPTDPRIKRHTEYVPRPPALSREALITAHEIYGETIASFAESYVGTGRYVARGECWDLAHEALQLVTSRMPDAIPIPSIGRTHGHLIYSGRVGEGRWRGGDDRIRRGDIVEWRRVRITARRGFGMGFSTLGDPDHTAIVTRDLVPAAQVTDGASVAPAMVGVLEVVEQSVGSPPKKETYDLSGMSEGEVWVYRPVGMRAYMGFEYGPDVPREVRTYTV